MEQTLTPTAEFPHAKFPFESFNPMQSSVLPHIAEDCNLVVAAPTSAGKTVAAELLIAYTLAVEESPCIFLSPLKAVTQEKYDEWREDRFAGRRISIVTGDYTLTPDRVQELNRAEIILLTSEMLDSRTRRMRQEKNEWLLRVKALVCDEVHLLTTERGHALESGIMRFTEQNPESRLCVLSATMPNVAELGDWLTKLNGKPTRVIQSTWRPVPHETHYVPHPPCPQYSYADVRDAKIEKVIELVTEDFPTDKWLVFVHEKATGKMVLEKLKRKGISVEFHSADLDRDSRVRLEGSFRSRDGVRVLIATSTLAWGVNTPARRVVICGVHRGMGDVSVIDLHQMAGRAGRTGLDDRGDAYVLYPANKSPEDYSTVPNIESWLVDDSTISFHLIAEMDRRAVRNAPDLCSWHSRSLAAQQGDEIDVVDASRIFGQLHKWQCIKSDSSDGDFYSATPLGRVASLFYLHPLNVFTWAKNLELVKSKNLWHNDAALAWAIACLPFGTLDYVSRDTERIVDMFDREMRRFGVRAELPGVVEATVMWLVLIGEKTDGAISPIARAHKYDAERMVAALTMLDSMHGHWNQGAVWATLAMRIKYGVGKELLDLVRIPGIGAVRAKRLYEAGFTTVESVAAAPTLAHVLGTEVSKTTKDAALGLLQRTPALGNYDTTSIPT